MNDVVVTAARETDEYDEPLAGLPQAGSIHFTEDRHIDGATAEVRFATASTALPESVATRVWHALGGASVYPLFEPASTGSFALTVTPQGAATQTQVVNGWRLSTADGAASLTLFPSLIALQTNKYGRYSTDLGKPLAAALDAFANAADVAMVNRIGLRYINRLTNADAAAPQFWRAAVRPPFAAVLGDEHLGPLVQAAHQQVELKLDAAAGGRVICGAFEQDEPAVGHYGFVIDIDVFRNEAIPFEPTTVANLARQLNRTALSLFRLVLSDDMLGSLGAVSTQED